MKSTISKKASLNLLSELSKELDSAIEDLSRDLYQKLSSHNLEDSQPSEFGNEEIYRACTSYEKISLFEEEENNQLWNDAVMFIANNIARKLEEIDRIHDQLVS